MRYMMLIHQDANNIADPAGQQALYAAWGAFNEALAKAEGAAPGERMQPATEGKTVRTRDGETRVVDGPYSDAKEQLGGYFFIEAKDFDEAVKWAELCPASKYGAIEIRPIVQPDKNW
ncbi:MAG: YciI family protein [Devosia sp.]